MESGGHPRDTARAMWEKGIWMRRPTIGLIAAAFMVLLVVPAQASIRGKALKQTNRFITRSCERLNDCASFTATCGKPKYSAKYRETRVPCSATVSFVDGRTCYLKLAWVYKGTKPYGGGVRSENCAPPPEG
jgi:hypothetical protein